MRFCIASKCNILIILISQKINLKFRQRQRIPISAIKVSGNPVQCLSMGLHWRSISIAGL